jgi:ankyrin repeat protein
MSEDDMDRERLHFAAGDGDLAAVVELIAAGYDVNAKDPDLKLTPLHYAARGEHLDVAQYLLDHGADVNAIDHATAGNTPLADIAQECSYEMAKLLLDYGANPITPGWMQLNALHRSERRKRPAGVRVHELLLDYARRKFHYAG